VIGGGFSGVETVGEMKELIDRSLKFHPRIDPSEVRVQLVEFAPRILNEMPERLARYAADHLTRHGVELKLDTGVASATGTQLVSTTGKVIDTRTIVATIGNSPLPVVARMGLPSQHGRITADRTLRVKGHDNVWALGDCALIPLKDGAEARTDFAPPTAQFAVREAERIARNIAAAVWGKPVRPFAYRSRGSLASLGAHRGVAEVFGMQLTGFPAWVLWRSYYLALLPGMGTRIKVMVNWTLDMLGARSVVQLRALPRAPMRYAHFRAGDIVYEAGHRSDGSHSEISGAVEMERTDPATGERHVRRIGPGGHFGERLILGATRRKTTVRAVEDTRVLVPNREEFLMLVEGFPAFREYFRPYMEARGAEWPPKAG